MTCIDFVCLKAFLSDLHLLLDFYFLLISFHFGRLLLVAIAAFRVAGKNAGFLRVVRCRSLGSEYDSTTFKSSELGVFSYFADVT